MVQEDYVYPGFAHEGIRAQEGGRTGFESEGGVREIFLLFCYYFLFYYM